MALVSAQRCQTLSALSIDFMNSTATGTQFVVNSLLKSSIPGKSSLMVSLPAFPENEKLCAHSTLLHYLARTASIRQSLKRHCLRKVFQVKKWGSTDFLQT